jgi:hypothetical protein
MQVVYGGDQHLKSEGSVMVVCPRFQSADVNGDLITEGYRPKDVDAYVKTCKRISELVARLRIGLPKNKRVCAVVGTTDIVFVTPDDDGTKRDGLAKVDGELVWWRGDNPESDIATATPRIVGMQDTERREIKVEYKPFKGGVAGFA